MGNYSIIINGTGPIHNGDADKDADQLTAAFVATLQKQGHTIKNASFSCNEARSLIPPVATPPGE
jgi:hypothetical protein